MHANGESPAAHWQNNAVYLSDQPLGFFNTSTGDADGRLPLGPRIMHSGETTAGIPGIEFWNGNDRTYLDAESTFGQWLDFSFELKVDGSYDYFIADSLVLSSDAGLLDFDSDTEVRLVVAGRSVGTTALMDNISVQVIPAPGTAAFLSLAMCIRRRRRAV